MRWSGCSERARRTKLDSASRDLLSFQHRLDSVPRAMGNDKRKGARYQPRPLSECVTNGPRADSQGAALADRSEYSMNYAESLIVQVSLRRFDRSALGAEGKEMGLMQWIDPTDIR